MCVLLIDSSLESTLTLKGYLHEEYEDVLVAHSAAEGLAQLREGGEEPRVQVVLLDVALPDLGGLEACRRIKEDARTRHVPVLVVTAISDIATLREAFAAGACDFLAKPVLPCELLARVRSALNLKREIDQRRARERELEALNERLMRANDELRALAEQDGLTGLANRRRFDTLLRQEWSRGTRTGLPLSLVLIDVDHFKRFNDRHGHLRGDDCLRLVATALKPLARRPGDCVARIGGEEFALLLPQTAVQGAAALAEQARAAVQGLAMEHGDSPACPQVTISLGVACAVPDRQGDQRSLLEAADLALYEAKRRGRNQVRIYLVQLSEGPTAPHLPADWPGAT